MRGHARVPVPVPAGRAAVHVFELAAAGVARGAGAAVGGVEGFVGVVGDFGDFGPWTGLAHQSWTPTTILSDPLGRLERFGADVAE